MELILKSNNEQSMAKIMALAKKLNVVIEKKESNSDDASKNAIKERILNFKGASSSSFGDAETWQKEQREDRDLPLS